MCEVLNKGAIKCEILPFCLWRNAVTSYKELRVK